MATKKLTITLDERQLARVTELVKAGKASSVSGFVKHAVGIAIADVDGWGAMLGQALSETGGPLTRRERAWADALLEPRKPAPRRRRRTAA